jgi:hypothetical protein
VIRVASFAGQNSSAARAPARVSPTINIDTSHRRFIGRKWKVERRKLKDPI